MRCLDFRTTPVWKVDTILSGTLIFMLDAMRYTALNFVLPQVLYCLLAGLQLIYQTLEGTAEYRHLYENDFQFIVKMTRFGHANITGSFHEFPHLSNVFIFEMETDQTCIEKAMNDLKAVERAFCDAMEK